MDRKAMLTESINAAWESFENTSLVAIDCCNSRDECMVVASALQDRCSDIQRLIDDGCYQRAFDLEGA